MSVARAAAVLAASHERTLEFRKGQRDPLLARERQEFVLRAVGPASTPPIADSAVPHPEGASHRHNAAELVNQVHVREIDTERVVSQGRNVACVERRIRHNARMPAGKKTPFNVAAGRRLATLRLALGLGQEAFGKALGLTRQGVSNYECGARDLDAEKMTKLFDEFLVSTECIYRGSMRFMPAEIRERIEALDAAMIDAELAPTAADELAKRTSKPRAKRAPNKGQARTRKAS